MARWTNVITTAGQALIVQAPGKTFNFTRAECGSGYVPVDRLADQAAITNVEKSLSITNMSGDENVFKLRLQLSNAGLQTPFELYQIGVYAKTGTGAEVLFLIIQAETPDIIPSSLESPNYVNDYIVNTIIGNAASITGNIDSAAYVTVGQFQSGLKGNYDETIAWMDTHIGQKASASNCAHVKVPGGNGLTVTADGTLSMGLATASLPGALPAGGNAPSATKLYTSRNIGNAPFNGTADITLAQIGALPVPSGTAPRAVTNVAVATDGNIASLTWDDSRVNGSPDPNFAGAIVVRKVRTMPTSPTDGTVVCDSTRHDLYSQIPFHDILPETDSLVYWYRIFPYNSTGKFNTQDESAAYCNILNNVWRKLTLSSGISAANAAIEGAPRICRIGNHVYISGSILGVAAANATIATLPTDCWPTNGAKYAIVPASGTRFARVFVNTSGALRLEWDSVTPYDALRWYSICMDYFID